MEWFVWRRRFKEETTADSLPLDCGMLLLLLDLWQFVFNDTFQQRKESFTRDVELKACLNVSLYPKCHGDIMIPMPEKHKFCNMHLLSKGRVDHYALCFGMGSWFSFELSTNKWAPVLGDSCYVMHGFGRCNGFVGSRNILHQTF